MKNIASIEKDQFCPIRRFILYDHAIDMKCRSIDVKGPSIDAKGPSMDAKGPRSMRRAGSRLNSSVQRQRVIHTSSGKTLFLMILQRVLTS